MKVKKGDKVLVTTGKYKGTEGLVLKSLPKLNKVIVENVNVKKRALKKSDSNNESYAFFPHPIDASNVRLVENDDSKKKENKKVKSSETSSKKKSK